MFRDGTRVFVNKSLSETFGEEKKSEFSLFAHKRFISFSPFRLLFTSARKSFPSNLLFVNNIFSLPFSRAAMEMVFYLFSTLESVFIRLFHLLSNEKVFVSLSRVENLLQRFFCELSLFMVSE